MPIDACQFCYIHSFFFCLYFVLSFCLLLPFQFSLFPTLVVILLSFMATIPIHTRLILSILPLFLTNHFSLLWTPLQCCPLPCWPFSLYYVLAWLVFSLSSTTHPTKISYLFDSAVSLSLSF